jgi:hypothetical protein
MIKPKVILELEIDETKLPKDWEKYLEEFFLNLDNQIITFGQETKKLIKIKKIEISTKTKE